MPTFPIDFPRTTGALNVKMRANRVDALSASPLTYAGQVVQHAGQRFEVDLTLVPMDRAEAEAMIAFDLQLDGRSGTFTFGHPDAATPRGAGGGTPLVDGAGQTGQTLAIKGGPLSTAGWLLAGDFIQLGSGADQRFYKLTADADTDGSGDVTVEFWPALRASPADDDAVTITNCKSVFRKSNAVSEWDMNEALHYGMTFSFVEAL